MKIAHLRAAALVAFLGLVLAVPLAARASNVWVKNDSGQFMLPL